VMVGDEVTITVLGVKGKQVRIGIEAPRSVPVHREDIYQRIRGSRVRPQWETAEAPVRVRRHAAKVAPGVKGGERKSTHQSVER